MVEQLLLPSDDSYGFVDGLHQSVEWLDHFLLHILSRRLFRFLDVVKGRANNFTRLELSIILDIVAKLIEHLSLVF